MRSIILWITLLIVAVTVQQVNYPYIVRGILSSRLCVICPSGVVY